MLNSLTYSRITMVCIFDTQAINCEMIARLIASVLYNTASLIEIYIYSYRVFKYNIQVFTHFM